MKLKFVLFSILFVGLTFTSCKLLKDMLDTPKYLYDLKVDGKYGIKILGHEDMIHGSLSFETTNEHENIKGSKDINDFVVSHYRGNGVGKIDTIRLTERDISPEEITILFLKIYDLNRELKKEVEKENGLKDLIRYDITIVGYGYKSDLPFLKIPVNFHFVKRYYR
ncbi:hypothetical protein EZS27_010894 [termite gut metagenome]|uniref:Lipoprotein n=1 Tax=termite gut metagenome TaxID=433724 RepID=A0A5J4S575_9ZZZZ